ncbi:retropepsin-like aspartic protease [Aspergillus mulundensis]|uniref:Uncharacterized protein n=1 Tax=Aspergillus mulundensis TaxID=1810919 RepID=A0A3D8QVN5_9EURO|nr:hypothetical protein DSM5745_09568 [Aspergillus mulundensis]RDW65829.1 hypothetical protein DSM5745_09568 [Aspergillus mulundensis]
MAPNSHSTQKRKLVINWDSVRSKLSKLSSKKLNRFIRNLASRDRGEAAAEQHPGGQTPPSKPRNQHYRNKSPSSQNHIHLSPPSQLPAHYGSPRPSGSSRTLSVDANLVPRDIKAPELLASPSGSLDLDSGSPSAADILVRLPGDKPERSQQMTASIGTQCAKIDLTRRKPWNDRPNDEVHSGCVHDLGSGLDIVVRLPGDAPDRTQQVTASMDTQLIKINLMRREVWDRLNIDGRGNLEHLDDDYYVRNLGSEEIRIEGVVRNLEWRFKKGAKTYQSDFYIISMRYDVLIGTDTINAYRLLRVGSDLLEHLEKMNGVMSMEDKLINA